MFIGAQKLSGSQFNVEHKPNKTKKTWNKN